MVETLWFRVRDETRNCGMILGLCCRPPDQSEKMGKAFFAQLMMFLKHLFFRGETLTLVFRGDFNFPGISWTGSVVGCKQSQRFLEGITGNFLMLVIERPDRLLE